MTSSLPGEGKTTLCAWMARMAARSGERVIVVDCDLRRPALHNAFRIANNATLVDYLTGQMELQDIINKDDKSGLHIITGKPVPTNALDLLSSPKMKKLVASLREMYDLVILDSPTSLAVSDGRVVAQMSDRTLYVVHWGKTARPVVMSGLKQFEDVGYQNIGLVLSRVDIRKHASYGFGDTGHYYSRYKEYYAAS